MKKRKHKNIRVKVFSAFIQSDIESAKMALERDEIPYETINDLFSPTYLTTVDIFVNQNDAERALAILRHLIKKEK